MPPIFLLLILYFLPTIVAYYKGYDRVADVAVTNLFLGWTVYPWMMLVWIVWNA